MEIEQRCELRGVELADMRPQAEPVFKGSLQNTHRLLHGERAALAEDIDKRGQLAPSGGGNHFFTNDAHILFGMVAVLGRDHVRAKQRRHNGSLPMSRGGGDRLSDFISAWKLRP